jgi:3beta-hydroxy-delta5-steroid dehydrogenase/steroid delta-isomerase
MNTSSAKRAKSNKKINIGPACMVTGGAGFLGKALTRTLAARGYEVHALDVKPGFERHKLIKTFIGDIRDYETVRKAAAGCFTLFHTAAVMNFLGICDASTWRHVRSINVDGTLNVIRACHELGIPRLVYTSTDSVCYSEKPLVNGDESLPYPGKCLDIYAKTKIKAEKAVLEADGREGLRTVAIRPAGIWGPGEGCYMVSKLVSELKKGSFVATVGDCTSLADNTHVENLVAAEILAAEKLIVTPDVVGGQAYFITDEEQMNLIEWFRPLIEGLGYKIPTRSIPTRVMYGLAFLMEWLHRFGGPKPFMTRLEVHNLTSSFTFRCDKARRDLGYNPKFGRNEGMKQCLEYYRDSPISKEGSL